jgi:hypothetical protein
MRREVMFTSESARGFESKSELELILLVVSSDPGSVLSKITGLTSIGNYQLVANPTLSLHDIYVDTPDHSLGRKRINLRVRGNGDNYWLTMKVSKGLLARRRHERQEFEVPWSKVSLDQIAGELSRKGIDLKVPTKLTETVSQVEVMKSMGLEVLQDRETKRHPRDVIDRESSPGPMAEFAIDTVLYHFPGRDVRLFEAELEAKSQKGRSVLRELSGTLLRGFGSDLRAWRFGKLTTGEKIQRLLKNGELDSYLDGSILRPEAYQKIERA